MAASALVPVIDRLLHVRPARVLVTSEFGHLTPEEIRRHADELPDAVFPLTGPAALVTDVVATLRDVRVPRAPIRLSEQSLPFSPHRRS